MVIANQKRVENGIAKGRRASEGVLGEVKSKRRKGEKEERKSRNQPCRSEGAKRKKKTKNFQELDHDHQEGEVENGENIQADEETAIEMHVFLKIIAQLEKGESHRNACFSENHSAVREG